MGIAPAHTKPQLAPNFDSWRCSREQKQGSESFGEILAAVMDQQFALKDGASVAIGEDAVRFDARPMIGQAFVTAVPVEVASRGYMESARPTFPTIDFRGFEPEFWRAIAVVAPRIAALVSGPMTRTVTALASGGLPAGPAKAGVAQLVEPLGSPRANRWVVPEGAAAPAVPSDAGKSEISADISLTLLADEVLVTVKGLDLSADEEEALADEARRLLASFDLGRRTLRVVTPRRA